MVLLVTKHSFVSPRSTGSLVALQKIYADLLCCVSCEYISEMFYFFSKLLKIYLVVRTRTPLRTCDLLMYMC